MALASPLLRLAGCRCPGKPPGPGPRAWGGSCNLPGCTAESREYPVTTPGLGCGCAFRGPQIRRGPLTHQTTTRRHAMRALRYAPGATIAAASMALGLVVVMSLPHVRRNLKIRKA